MIWRGEDEGRRRFEEITSILVLRRFRLGFRQLAVRGKERKPAERKPAASGYIRRSRGHRTKTQRGLQISRAPNDTHQTLA